MQDAIDRKAEEERLKLEAAEQAERLHRARAVHQRAVELVKEATRTGKGAAAADIAWREAKAELLELETGKRPAWAARSAESEERTDIDQTDQSDDGESANEVDVEAIDGA
jgi:hypothetical protein